MKKVRLLVSVVLFGFLLLSSCDKKDAILVNKRTATPEGIEEAERVKAKEKERLAVTPVRPSQYQVIETTAGPDKAPVEKTLIESKAENLLEKLIPSSKIEKKDASVSEPARESESDPNPGKTSVPETITEPGAGVEETLTKEPGAEGCLLERPMAPSKISVPLSKIVEEDAPVSSELEPAPPPVNNLADVPPTTHTPPVPKKPAQQPASSATSTTSTSTNTDASASTSSFSSSLASATSLNDVQQQNQVSGDEQNNANQINSVVNSTSADSGADGGVASVLETTTTYISSPSKPSSVSDFNTPDSSSQLSLSSSSSISNSSSSSSSDLNDPSLTLSSSTSSSSSSLSSTSSLPSSSSTSDISPSSSSSSSSSSSYPTPTLNLCLDLTELGRLIEKLPNGPVRKVFEIAHAALEHIGANAATGGNEGFKIAHALAVAAVNQTRTAGGLAEADAYAAIAARFATLFIGYIVAEVNGIAPDDNRSRLITIPTDNTKEYFIKTNDRDAANAQSYANRAQRCAESAQFYADTVEGRARHTVEVAFSRCFTAVERARRALPAAGFGNEHTFDMETIAAAGPVANVNAADPTAYAAAEATFLRTAAQRFALAAAADPANLAKRDLATAARNAADRYADIIVVVAASATAPARATAAKAAAYNDALYAAAAAEIVNKVNELNERYNSWKIENQKHQLLKPKY